RATQQHVAADGFEIEPLGQTYDYPCRHIAEHHPSIGEVGVQDGHEAAGKEGRILAARVKLQEKLVGKRQPIVYAGDGCNDVSQVFGAPPGPPVTSVDPLDNTHVVACVAEKDSLAYFSDGPRN